MAVFDVGLVAEAGSLPGGHVDGNGFLILSDPEGPVDSLEWKVNLINPDISSLGKGELY